MKSLQFSLKKVIYLAGTVRTSRLFHLARVTPKSHLPDISLNIFLSFAVINSANSV